ncbi:MAG: threonine synthase [Cardiobacteriaceae bacterium]|nr:threonine synthase [Cardiobacteriaceae bacterium]
MRYISTRGAELGSFCDVLLQGLAPDGGLAMPETIPQFSLADIDALHDKPYAQIAYTVMRPYISDISEQNLANILINTYTAERFRNQEITPLSRLGSSNIFLLELSNGPSLAFKDVAMQFLASCFEFVLNERKTRLNILGATSGDTGSAAEYAVLGKKNLNIFMLSPLGRMSPFQQAQMYSLNAPNIFNLAVQGVFDDCQDLVKAVNRDGAFKEKYAIGAVNSINWARILAQSVYYFKAYLSLGITTGEVVDFCVPSGNFGNIFAGYLAKRMGLPIRNLIVASNENDVLAEFFLEGNYRVRAASEVMATSSPSMDIGKASNFERYLYLILGENPMQIAAMQGQLNHGGVLNFVPNTQFASVVEQSGFLAGRSRHQDRIETIRQVYQGCGRIIDPHTADGVFVAQRYLRDNTPMICLETALPAKFSATVQEAIGIEPPRPPEFIDIENKPRFGSVIANSVDELKSFISKTLGY